MLPSSRHTNNKLADERDNHAHAERRLHRRRLRRYKLQSATNANTCLQLLSRQHLPGAPEMQSQHAAAPKT
eukprot:6686373-Lingulodinium_polyedra.AAC.1